MSVRSIMRLPNTDLHRVLYAVNVLNSDHAPETLARRTFDSVKGLIPTDVISYEGFGRDVFYQGPLWFEPTENVSDQMLAAMGKYVSGHPIFIGAGIREMSRSARVSNFVTLPEFKRTAIYNEFFRLLGTDRQLTAALHITPYLTVSCSLCRVGKDYTERDCAKLDLLTPHLASAFRNARFIQNLSRQSEEILHISDGAEIGFISLDAFLNPLNESRNARGILARYFSDDSAVLPGELRDYAGYQLTAFAKDEFYLPPKPLDRHSQHGKLIVRIVFHSSTRTSFLLIEEISDPMRRARLPQAEVTPRENEVLSWLGRGKTDPEIAQILDISVRTVHKHVENIFRKIGVETRTAAMLKVRHIG